MRATLIRKTDVYIQCATCGDESSHCVTNIDPGTSFGPSYCNNCGAGIRGYVNGSGAIDIEEAEYRRVPAHILLRILPQADPVFLVVQGADLVPTSEHGCRETAECAEEFLDSDEFFYGYASDPSITLQNALALIRGTEFAPPGLFQYVTKRAASRPACGYSDESSLTDAFGEFIKAAAVEPITKEGGHNDTQIQIA